MNLKPFREGTYTVPGKGRVYYQDASTVKDAMDLYAILSEQATTGSPSVSNQLARAFVERLQTGMPLSGEQLAKLLQLVRDNQQTLSAYRASGRDQSTNLLDTPSPDLARLLDTPTGGENP